MENKISICGDQAVFMPELANCDECDQFDSRLKTIETLLANMRRVEIAKTDVAGQTITVTSVGEVTGG